MRSRLSGTYQGAELDRIINTFRASRPDATPARLYFAITTSPIFPLGSPHASDINLKFANTGKNLDFVLYADQSPGRLTTARHMSGLWAGFARKGRPTAKDVPTWPAYTPRRRATMWLDAECRIVDDPDWDERLFWRTRA